MGEAAEGLRGGGVFAQGILEFRGRLLEASGPEKVDS
jgi:hypothetical protein